MGPNSSPLAVAPTSSTAASLPASSGAIDPEAKNYAYPFDVKTFRFQAQGQALTMAYLDVESKTPNGRVVVLLHGKNFSAAYWEPTIRSLTRSGYRVIAPDQIGFGKSSKPVGYHYSFNELAGNTRALLAAVGVQSSTVVGHSMGGMLAARYALLFADKTEKLVLVDPIGLEDYGAVLPFRSVDELYRRELAQTEEKVRAYVRNAYFGGQWKPEYEALVELQAGWLKHPEYRRVAWAAALTASMIITQPVVHDLPRLRVPTLLIVGLHDRAAVGKDAVSPEVAAKLGNFPVLGKRAARAIPGAQLVELAAAGHLPQVDSFPEYERALLGFLREDERGSVGTVTP